jgi:hypothetical protein
MKRISPSTVALAAVLLLFTSGLLSCAHLDTNADPLIVRAEQVEQGAISTFDLVLNLDNANRPFWRTNIPPFHSFCEYLRAPQVVNVTNTVPRGVAMVISLQTVKAEYRTSKASSNLLITATATLSSAVNQATSWLSLTTNTAVPKTINP